MPDAYDELIARGTTCQGIVAAEVMKTGPSAGIQTGRNSDTLVVRVTATNWVAGVGIGGKMEAAFAKDGTSIMLPNASMLPKMSGTQRLRVTLFDDPCCPNRREVIELGPPTAPGTYPVLCRALEGTTRWDWRAGDYYCADMTAGQMATMLANMTGQSRNPPFSVTNNFVSTNVANNNTMPPSSNFTPVGVQN